MNSNNSNMTKEKDLESVKLTILNKMKCPLKDNAINLVFGKGNPDAKILFIGEAPGAKEDKLGLPFVGSSGKRLDKLLQTIDLNLDQIYIANILKYRPPNNRNPTKEEIYRHTPYLIEQIKIIRPQIICTLGNYATKFVLASFNIENMKDISGISQIHGTVNKLTIAGMEFIVIPLYHPAATIYNPKLKAILEQDFLNMKKVLKKA